jgi:hypothetical protein
MATILLPTCQFHLLVAWTPLEHISLIGGSRARDLRAGASGCTIKGLESHVTPP